MKNTTLCYIKQNDKYLMLHRTKKSDDSNEGKWIGIGGHMEDGESPEECVVREVREETGLILKAFRYRALVTFTSDMYETEYMHLFTADKIEGAITDNCEEGVNAMSLFSNDQTVIDQASAFDRGTIMYNI